MVITRPEVETRHSLQECGYQHCLSRYLDHFRNNSTNKEWLRENMGCFYIWVTRAFLDGNTFLAADCHNAYSGAKRFLEAL